MFCVAVTMLSFICGGATSLLCGYIGMRIAVYANVRTCHQSWLELEKGFKTALQAGSIMGFSVVSLSILSIFSLIIFFRLQAVFGTTPEMQPSLFEALAGTSSNIYLFIYITFICYYYCCYYYYCYCLLLLLLLLLFIIIIITTIIIIY